MKWLVIPSLLAAVVWAASAAPPPIQGLPVEPSSKPAKRPGTNTVWAGLSVRRKLPLFAGPDGDTPLQKADAPVFNELVYIMKKTPNSRNPYLLARFRVENGRRVFDSWLGWARDEDLLLDGSTLTADAARQELMGKLGEFDPRFKSIKKWLPLAADRKYRNVTLRAITDPETGIRAFLDPVSAAQQAKEIEKAARTGAGTALAPFSFYHVLKMVPEGDEIHCLLARREKMDISDTMKPAVFRNNVLGWVPLKVLLFWTTREAFEPDFSAESVERRASANEAVTIWASRQEVDRSLSDSNATGLVPVYRESADDPLVQAFPWPANWMRYPVLEKYKDGDRLSYRIGLLGGKGGQSVTLATTADLVANLDLVKQTIQNAHVVQLVLVLDGTNSMSPVIEATREAITAFVKDLREDEQKQPELSKLEIRVAVVVYTDHPDKFPPPAPPLVRDSGRYFLVQKDDELKAFNDFMGSIKTAPNNFDLEEEPFEGIEHAAEKLTRPGPSSLSTRGATNLMLLIGNSGNNVKGRGFKGSPSTRMTLSNAIDCLGPRKYDGGAGVEERGARVMLFPVWTPYKPNLPEKKIWDEQVSELAKASGGTCSEIEFTSEAQTKAAPEKLRRQVHYALEETRENMRRQLDALRGKRIVKPGKPGQLTGPVHYQLALERLREVIGDEARFQQVVEQLSSSFFAQTYTTGRMPSDPKDRPRMRTCILLTIREVITLEKACGEIAKEYREALDDLDEKKTDTDTYRKLLVKVLAAVLGNITDDKELQKLEGLPLQDLQDRISVLPVRIACLGRDGPANDKEARDLCGALDRAAGRLKDLFTRDAAKRQFYPGGDATADPHVWAHEEELP
ncbi:MAG TPA: vWA domain-containing protein [Gemmataceae bacterium]|nr:vWA domain-containing protein [Gemmataceae bacterium]